MGRPLTLGWLVDGTSSDLAGWWLGDLVILLAMDGPSSDLVGWWLGDLVTLLAGGWEIS